MDNIWEITPLRTRLRAERVAGKRIVLVPTMGSLHEGHLTLVDVARQRGDVVVMTLFVNPLQFAPGEDFDRYPRDFARDAALAASRGVDILFAPSVEEMYGGGRELRITGSSAANGWEGAIRPGHFDGVLTVVAKLVNIVQPDAACFGQKDIQQVTLVRQLIRELDFPIEFVMVPTVRESDGLALSSRNVYLSATERHSATALSASLGEATAVWRAGTTDPGALRRVMESVLSTRRPGAPLVADYIAIVDALELAPATRVVPGTIIALAVRVGKTRLIDNIILGA